MVERPWVALAVGASCLMASPGAWAVPSFARQTGLSCNVCHTTFPELTPFGRLFKLNGYVLTGLRQIESPGSDALKINAVPPLSAMIQIAVTHMAKAEPPQGTPPAPVQNNVVEFPQQLSFFFAGEISPHMGSFMQFTYDHQSDHFSLDNTDIRYANHLTLGGKDTIYGLTLNNNPTVEDPWNDTPAWGFPWASPDTAVGSAGSAIIDGTLAQSVAGIGAYSLWNNAWYGNVSVYRSSTAGVSQPLPQAGAIDGVAPYWRLAWQHQFDASYLEIGTFGIHAAFNGGLLGLGQAGMDDRYTDVALDTQYERPVGSNLLSVHAVVIRERQSLASSAAAGLAQNPYATLTTARLDGTWHFDQKYATSLGLFGTHGTADALLYTPAPLTGSANQNPNTRGWVAQATYLPWENTQFALQYTAYTEFNGGSSNYDGSGRSAADNNTLYLLAWLVW
ncbi:MAG TPA: hypothetical protein VFN52_06595 [Acidiferrobacteraceae bacterium]|nr:hypothetical protein [Acidiferrobacteraceae bacterium]